MVLAVIKTGGKQYIVTPGKKIKISPSSLKLGETEKIKGKELIFDKVLLLEKNKKIEIGQPFIKNAKVIGKVLKQGKGKKVIVFKYKPKKRYKKKKGHRQKFIEVEIKKIETK
jgi:large subunit ribosomal protein L21